MAKLYVRKSDGTYVPQQSVLVSNLDIVQEKGDSLTSAMSQKAVTDELGTIQDAIASVVNAGYVFAGVATPSTNPETPNAKVFYIANGKGIYTNFGGLEVTEDEVVVLKYDTAWHKVATGIASDEKLSELEQKVGDLVYSATLENVASSTIFVRDLHIGAGKYYLYADINGISCRKQVDSSYPILAQSIAKTWVAFTNDEATELGLLQQVSGGVQSFSVIVVSESVLAETIKNRLSIDDNANAINKNAEDIASLPNELLLSKELDAFSSYSAGIIKNNGAIQIMSDTRYHLSSSLAVKEGDVVFATLAYQIQSAFSQMWGYADADCTQPIMELLPCASSYVNKAVVIPVGSGIRYVRAWNDTLRSTDEHLKLITESPVEEVVKDNTGRIIEVDKNGSGGFSNLLDAVLYAEQFNGTKVIVKRGEYDLINEFKSLYGSDFFDSYDGSGSRGIPLKNNIEIVFEEGAIVKCNYSGTNSQVMSIFSAFLAREKGFILDGLVIDCTNIRYCVHDERGTSSDSYHNIYRNCVMKLDNSANTAWASKQCIGGGLGKNGRIEVIDCIFESVGAGNNAKVVSWHNNTNGDSKSELTIRGNYFKNGTFALTWYGASTEKTIAKVSNNRLRSEPIHSAEGSATIVNTELLMWNNTVE